MDFGSISRATPTPSPSPSPWSSVSSVPSLSPSPSLWSSVSSVPSLSPSPNPWSSVSSVPSPSPSPWSSVSSVPSPTLSPSPSPWSSVSTKISRGGTVARGGGWTRGTEMKRENQNLFSTIQLNTPLSSSSPSPSLSSGLSSTSKLPELPFALEYIHGEIILDEDAFLQVENAEFKELNNGISVLQDHSIPYSGKLRGHRAMQIIKNMGKEGVVMASNNYGMGQVALAAMCKYHGLKCKIFLTDMADTPMSIKARQLGADIVMNNFNLKDAKNASVIFAQSYKSKMYWMEPGLVDSIFIDSLTENIKSIKVKYSLKPTEIWVASYTGMYASCLASAFPEIKINIVSVGPNIHEDLLVGKNYTIFRYTDGSYHTIYPDDVPYETTKNYDAKVWHFRNSMKPGALIWNVY